MGDLTGKQMAELLGISGAMVSKARAKGMPMSSVEEARRWREDRLAYNLRKDVNPTRTGTKAVNAAPDGRLKEPPAAQQPGYIHSRARREQAEAEMAELNLAKAREEVIEKEPAVMATFTAFRGLRDEVMQVGRRVSARCASMNDPREIQLLIDATMRDLLTSFAQRTLSSVAGRLNQGKPVELPAGLAPTSMEPAAAP